MTGPTRTTAARGLPLIALIATLTAASGRPAAARPMPKTGDYEQPSAAWREGPVRYLLSKDEDDAFRLLTTDAERGAFILKFWSSRDPQPATMENEYRTLFYRRVLEANRLFTESPKAGWKTDRGKIYILLGPPDELEQVGDPGTGHDAVLWNYRNPPAGTGLGARAAIRFVKDVTGEFMLSSHVALSGTESSLGLGFQVQAMQMKSIPPPRDMLDTIVNARSFLDSAPFRTHRDFFRSVDGNTFVVLTVGVKRGLTEGADLPGLGNAPLSAGAFRGGDVLGEGPLEVAGQGPLGSGPPNGSAPAGSLAEAAGSRVFEVLVRLSGEASRLPTYDLAGPDGLRAAGDETDSSREAFLLYQGIATVRPGNYTAYYGVADRRNGQVYSFKEEMAIPDLRSATLSLSSVTLASQLEPVTSKSMAGYKTPFILGNLKVLPRPDDVFRNGETLAFYYQIYSAATDPIDGRPDLEVEYQFYVARAIEPTGQPAFMPLGKPIRLTRQQNQVQGYSFPLKDWPAATYRLRVQVHDNLNGQQSSRDVTFHVL